MSEPLTHDPKALAAKIPGIGIVHDSFNRLNATFESDLTMVGRIVDDTYDDLSEGIEKTFKTNMAMVRNILAGCGDAIGINEGRLINSKKRLDNAAENSETAAGWGGRH